MVIIEATQRKSREARFFLQHLIAEIQKVAKQEPEAFGFYLSAFLSAARSVTWALQHEEKSKYDKWFPHWFETLSQDDQQLMNSLRDQRNYEQKRGSADIAVSTVSVPISQVRAYRPGHPALAFLWLDSLGAPETIEEIPEYSFNTENGKQEVVAACRHYQQLLEKLVEEFAQHYSNQSA